MEMSETFQPTYLVSVLIPTRNRKSMLRELVESIWKSTLDPSQFEIVISDNCSTDGTRELLKQLQAASPCRLRYNLMEENRGPAPSRNAAARMAEGEFLAFVDSDCRVSPQWLEAGLAPFADPAISFTTGAIFHKPEQPNVFFSRSHDPVTEETACYPTMNIIYRRSEFMRMGGFLEELCFKDFRSRVVECSDCDLAWRIKEAGGKNVFVRDMVVYHERERMDWLTWLLIPMEQHVVPLLISRHPRARRRLLWQGYFFNFLNAPFYVLCLGVILAGIFRNPWFLLLALPYPAVVARAVVRRWEPTPLQILAWVGLLGIRQFVLCSTLIVASLRHRTLVL